jgi:hypothetical protein
MGDSCPQPDTRNRYQGRGSGDRIARLKQIATREGPKPTNQNSESWLLTKQQGCCSPCELQQCNSTYDIQMRGTYNVNNDTYTIPGTLSGSSVVFRVALLAGSCATTANCRYVMGFVSTPAVSGLTYGSDVSTCGQYLIITLSPVPTGAYSQQVNGIYINTSDMHYAGNPLAYCGGAGDTKLVNLILTYTP